MKLLGINLLLLFVLFSNTRVLSQDSTRLNSEYKFDLSFIGQVNTFLPGRFMPEKGDNIYSGNSLRLGLEYGIGFRTNLSDKMKLEINYLFSNNTINYSVNDDYIKTTEDYFNQNYSSNNHYGWACYSNNLNYHKLEANFIYKYFERKKISAFAGIGLSLLHYQAFSSVEYFYHYDMETKVYTYFLENKIYQNSRYENGSYNKYKSVDLGINFLAGCDIQLKKNRILRLTLNTMFQPRYAHVMYYENTDINPIESSGKIVQPLSTFSLRIAYCYGF